MSEFIVSFELYTVLYILIFVPILFYLLKLAYWLADITIDQMRYSRSKRLVKESEKIIRENIKVSNELINVQEDLLQHQKLLKKVYDGDVE